jgi:hypothetical protein
MGAWLRTGCGLTAVVLVAAGCGGHGASAGERAAVREIVPGAEQISCERADALTRCSAVTGNGLVGKAWTCELEMNTDSGGVAYSGTHSCWTSRD